MYVDFIGDKVNNLTTERLLTLSEKNIYCLLSETYFIASFKLVHIRRVHVTLQRNPHGTPTFEHTMANSKRQTQCKEKNATTYLV